MRGRRLLIITLVLVPFLAVSAVLARVFSAEGAERSAIESLIADEARGDLAAVARRLRDCSPRPACREAVRVAAGPLAGAGRVSILQLTPSTGFSLTGGSGTARVAWRHDNALPIVQCVRIDRRGNAITGLRIDLLAVSGRIKSDANCPARF